jgi:hypothetical protein
VGQRVARFVLGQINAAQHGESPRDKRLTDQWTAIVALPSSLVWWCVGQTHAKNIRPIV